MSRISTWSRFYNSDVLLSNVHEIHFEMPQNSTAFPKCYVKFPKNFPNLS